MWFKPSLFTFMKRWTICMSIKQAKLVVNAHKHNLLNSFCNNWYFYVKQHENNNNQERERGILCDSHIMIIQMPMFLKPRDDGLHLTVNRRIFNISRRVVVAKQSMSRMLKLECRPRGCGAECQTPNQQLKVCL